MEFQGHSGVGKMKLKVALSWHIHIQSSLNFAWLLHILWHEQEHNTFSKCNAYSTQGDRHVSCLCKILLLPFSRVLFNRDLWNFSRWQPLSNFTRFVLVRLRTLKLLLKVTGEFERTWRIFAVECELTEHLLFRGLFCYLPGVKDHMFFIIILSSFHFSFWFCFVSFLYYEPAWLNRM